MYPARSFILTEERVVFIEVEFIASFEVFSFGSCQLWIVLIANDVICILFIGD